MKGLKIYVVGYSGSGKTTVAKLIEEMLREKGFEAVDLSDDDDPATDVVRGRAALLARHQQLEGGRFEIETVPLRPGLTARESVQAYATDKRKN